MAPAEATATDMSNTKWGIYYSYPTNLLDNSDYVKCFAPARADNRLSWGLPFEQNLSPPVLIDIGYNPVFQHAVD